jgi:hypothetical protein
MVWTADFNIHKNDTTESYDAEFHEAVRPHRFCSYLLSFLGAVWFSVLNTYKLTATLKAEGLLADGYVALMVAAYFAVGLVLFFLSRALMLSVTVPCY